MTIAYSLSIYRDWSFIILLFSWHEKVSSLSLSPAILGRSSAHAAIDGSFHSKKWPPKISAEEYGDLWQWNMSTQKYGRFLIHMDFLRVSKNRGKTSKMDCLFHGKSYKNGWFGVPPILGSTPTWFSYCDINRDAKPLAPIVTDRPVFRGWNIRDLAETVWRCGEEKVTVMVGSQG